MKLPVIDETLVGKKVFVRGDIDIPLNPLDDTRLKDIWPMVEFLLKQNCTVLLAGHLGRPGGKEDLSLSSKPVAEWLATRLDQMKDTSSGTQDRIKETGNGVSGVCLKGEICGFIVTEKLIVLENLRFDIREEQNDAGYAQELASLAEIYVNEAFATSWEEHASIVGVPKLLPHFAGFRLAKELEMLSKLTENPARPMVAIIGGAKIESKLPVITNLAKIADSVIVGGKLISEFSELSISSELRGKTKLLELGKETKDTTLESIDGVTDLINGAKTIVWGGPLGVVEEIPYQVGSRRVAELITNNTQAYKVIGGGDTVAFVDKLGLTAKFDWVSSGGGSMLKLLSGEKLPGIKALVA